MRRGVNLLLVVVLLAAGGLHASGQQIKSPRPAAMGTALPRDTSTIHNSFLMPVPKNFYTKTFGFFCRQELKMQQLHVPLTFRLGSMEYCNRLEQKPGYR